MLFVFHGYLLRPIAPVTPENVETKK